MESYEGKLRRIDIEEHIFMVRRIEAFGTGFKDTEWASSFALRLEHARNHLMKIRLLSNRNQRKTVIGNDAL